MRKITVITINYNNLQGLKRTVPSVLSQSYDDFEYVIVDGGSTDGSKEYIEQQHGIDTWVSEKDNGIYNAMNKAVGMAPGQYCIFTHSGDHFFSALSLENAAEELDGSDYCTGKTTVVEDDFLSLCIPPKTMTFYFVKGTSLQHQSTFIKTQLLKSHPYNEDLKIVADWEHFLKCWYLNNCSYKALQTVVAAYYLDGFSAQNVNLLKVDRKCVIDAIFEGNKNIPHIVETKQEKRDRLTDNLKCKLRNAMKKKPLSRDWKVMRNGFKFFFKDLFI